MQTFHSNCKELCKVNIEIDMQTANRWQTSIEGKCSNGLWPCAIKESCYK